jgi:hypothetical protein
MTAYVCQRILMSYTAYSKHFTQEFDFKQLLRLRGVTTSLEQANYGLSQAERDWIRGDLLCPSCRCGGASLVRSDSQGKGKNSRQAHFRFVDATGQTAHKLGCDFYSMDDVPGVQKGADVQFAANDRDTKIVRELVCKAITIGALSKSDIFSMRSWFIVQRDLDAFDVKGSPAVIDWLWEVWHLSVFEPMKFSPTHLAMPEFDVRRA